jgi:hypothetical protein
MIVLHSTHLINCVLQERETNDAFHQAQGRSGTPLIQDRERLLCNLLLPAVPDYPGFGKKNNVIHTVLPMMSDGIGVAKVSWSG